MPDWETCKHEFGAYKTLYYPETTIGFGSEAVCKKCGAVEWNDWCSTYHGTETKVLPPRKDSDAKSGK